jgi:hypothetical protein
MIVANNGSPAGGSRAAAGRRAAMRSTLDDHAKDPHNPRDNRQDHHPLTRTTVEVSRGAGPHRRAEVRGARYAVQPWTPFLGLAAASACRKDTTIALPSSLKRCRVRAEPECLRGKCWNRGLA